MFSNPAHWKTCQRLRHCRGEFQARQMHCIFESKEIHRKALAALLLFQQAAREERLTVDRVEVFI